jgi:hypothetical protein
MGFNKKALFMIKWYFVLTALVGIVACQGSLFSYRGRTVEPDRRIDLLEGGPHEGSRQTFDLTLEYQYEKKAAKLQLSGVAELSDHYKYNYASLAHFYLTAFCLDIEGKVLAGKLVLNAVSADLDHKFSFKKSLEIPPGTVSIAFDHMLGVREEVTNGRGRGIVH